ncbi:hypothetical protein, partial [Leptospira interrogans]|uniref:hypothetical protein n=2 Tax=Leptospira interrogans TaxID=173 RepID=UPI003D0279AA
ELCSSSHISNRISNFAVVPTFQNRISNFAVVPTFQNRISNFAVVPTFQKRILIVRPNTEKL